MATDFEMFSGDNKILSVSVVDSAGVAVDLTSATASWQLARSNDAAPLIQKATGGSGIVITDAAGGVLEITLSASDTDALKGSFYHELQVIDTSGNIATVLAGNATIKRDLIT